MIYLFIGSLLIIAAKSQSCYSDANCSAVLGFPYCDLSYGYPGFCSQCTNNTQCTAYGLQYCNYVPPPFGGFSVCSNETSPFCQYDSDCALDETCNYNPIFNTSLCSNETSPFCESDSDCGYGTACLPFSTTIEGTDDNNVTTFQNITLPYCLPPDQCAVDADCLLGSTCVPVFLGNDTGAYSFNACTGTADFSIPCMNDTDCGLEGLACFNSTFCVATCNTTADCGVAGYACVTPPGSDFMACAPAQLSMTTTRTPGVCDTNQDCSYPFPICLYGPNGFCVECENNTNCEMLNGPGSVCNYGTCMNATTSGPTTTAFVCNDNTDCGFPTPYCMYGECSECMNDTTCGYGYLCEYNFNGRTYGYRCVPEPTTTEGPTYCTSNDNCTIYDPVCGMYSGICSKCNNDTDCTMYYGSNYYCINGGYSNSYCEEQRTTPTPTTPAPTEDFDTLPPGYYVDANVACEDMVSGVTSMYDLVDYYRLSANETIEVTVSTCARAYNPTLDDTKLYIYNEANGNQVGYSDDDGSCSLKSEIADIFIPGDYIIAVTGYSSSNYGSYYLSIKCGTETTQFPFFETTEFEPDVTVPMGCYDDYDCMVMYGSSMYICIAGSCEYNDAFPQSTEDVFPGTTESYEECESDNDCDMYYPVCSTMYGYGECVQCREDSDCPELDYPDSYICSEYGYCEEGPCSTNRDCKDNDRPKCYMTSANEGMCAECAVDSDCPSDYGIASGCLYNTSFSSEPRCYVSECVTDDDCITGSRCYKDGPYGECYADYASCNTTADCADGLTCDNSDMYGPGSCYFACDIDDDCGVDGYICYYERYENRSRCVYDDGSYTPSPTMADQCIVDDDCITGSKCVEMTDYGHTYNECQMDNSDCTQSSDCADGLTCYTDYGLCYFACVEDMDCGIDAYICYYAEYEDISLCVYDDGTYRSTTTEMATSTEMPMSSTMAMSSTEPDDGPSTCTSNSDCGDDEQCTPIDIGNGIIVKVCAPIGIEICSSDDDCLPGETCLFQDGYPAGACFVTDVSTGCDPYGDDCDDGLTCYDGSSLNIDNFCYLLCQDAATDCGSDDYICATDAQTYNPAVVTTCIYNKEYTNAPTDSPSMEPSMEPTSSPLIEATNPPTMEPTPSPSMEPSMEPTDSPTMEPSEGISAPSMKPTEETEAPTENPTEDANISGVQQLAIFGGMIIMALTRLFM